MNKDSKKHKNTCQILLNFKIKFQWVTQETIFKPKYFCYANVDNVSIKMTAFETIQPSHSGVEYQVHHGNQGILYKEHSVVMCNYHSQVRVLGTQFYLEVLSF